MSVSLSIKNVPDDVVERLRARADRNKRSLQCELLHIVEEAAEVPPPMTLRDLYERGKAMGLSAPKGESVRIIRRMRDDRPKQVMRLIEKPRGRR